MTKKPRRGAPSLKRSKSSKSVATAHYVFCEGKTEKDCIDKLRQRYRCPSVKVEVVGQAGVPSTIVKKAVGKKEELARAKTKHLKTTIHVIFDRDEHPCFNKAIDQARAKDLSIGVSVPCFELWAILLHQDQSAFIDRHKAQSLLKKLHPGYNHSSSPVLDAQVVEQNWKEAAKRAALLAKRAAEAGRKFNNPTTSFPLVLKQIFDS